MKTTGEHIVDAAKYVTPAAAGAFIAVFVIVKYVDPTITIGEAGSLQGALTVLLNLAASYIKHK